MEHEDLEVSNQSSNPMTILGSVTVGGSKAGSPLDLVGSGASEFEVHTNSSGSLAIDGSVSFIESGTSSESNQIYTDGTGDLTIGRGVTENVGTGDSMVTDNDIYTAGAGGITIGGSVTQTAAATSMSENVIDTNPQRGNIAIGGSVTDTSTGTSTHENGIEADQGGGSIMIGQSVTINDSGSTSASNNDLVNDSAASITVCQSVTINESASAAFVSNESRHSGQSARSRSAGSSRSTRRIREWVPLL